MITVSCRGNFYVLSDKQALSFVGTCNCGYYDCLKCCIIKELKKQKMIEEEKLN